MSAVSGFEALRAGFLDALRGRHCAPTTVRIRDQGLTVLGAFLAEAGVDDVRAVTRQHVAAFQLWLGARSYATSTRCVHLSALRAFFAYLEQTDVILFNPCAGLLLPKLGGRLPRGVLTREEARRVLATPDTQARAGLRDRAIMEVFYSTGLRLSELARLRVLDVDCRHGLVRVNGGKGGRDRMVPLGARAIGCVREYLEQARALWANPGEQALWLGSIAPHDPLQAQAIQLTVRRHGRAAGLRVTPHLWRHTCATHLVSNGANLAEIQRLLGHASLETTQIYTRVTIAEIKATHRRAHPRSRAGLAGPMPDGRKDRCS